MADTKIDILVDLALQGAKVDDSHLQKLINTALTGMVVPDPTIEVAPVARITPAAQKKFKQSISRMRKAMETALAGELTKGGRNSEALKGISSKALDNLANMAKVDKAGLAQIHKVFGELETLLGTAKVGYTKLTKNQTELFRQMRAGELEFDKISSKKDRNAIASYLTQKERELKLIDRFRSRIAASSKATLGRGRNAEKITVPPILLKDLDVELANQRKQLANDQKLVNEEALAAQRLKRQQAQSKAALDSAERRRKLVDAVKKTQESVGVAGDPTALTRGQLRDTRSDLTTRRKAIETYYNSMSRAQRQNTALARSLRGEMERIDSLLTGVKQAPESIARRESVQRRLAKRASDRQSRATETASIERGFKLFDPRSDGDIERIKKLSAAEMQAVEQSIKLQKARDKAAVDRAQRLRDSGLAQQSGVDRAVARQARLLDAERRMEDFRKEAHIADTKRMREREQRQRAVLSARRASQTARSELAATAGGTQGFSEQALRVSKDRLTQAGNQIRSYMREAKEAGKDAVPVYKALENQLAKVEARAASLNKAIADRGRKAAMRELFLQTKQQARQGSRIAQDFGGVDHVPKEHLREVAEAYGLNVRRARELRAVQDLNTKAGQRRFRQLSKYINQTSNSIDMLNGKIRGNTSFLEQSNRLIRQFFRYALGYGALYQVLQGFSLLGRAVVGLNKELKSIQAIAQATDAQMSTMSASIKQVALNTKFGINEIAQAGRVLAQAGVKPEDFDATLANTAMFAAATETSIATAADLVSTMRNVFSELSDGTITNQLTKAINISKLTGEDLRTILSISSQVSKAYGLTSEQYLAAVTTLRNAGLKASTVATGLRQGLTEIFSPDSKTLGVLKKRYKELGENLTEEAIRGKFFDFRQSDNPLVSALRELQRLGFNGSGRRTFQRTFDIRAENALRAMISNLDELEGAQQRLTFGTAALDANQKQMESLSNSVDNLGAALTVFADSAVGGAVDGLESLTDMATNAVVSLTKLSDEMKIATGSGAGAVALQALAGGVTGAALAKGGVIRRAGGALVGAATGGYAGATATTASADAGLSSAAAAANGLVASLFAVSTLKEILSVFSKGGAKSGVTAAGQKYLRPEVLATHVSIASRAMAKISDWWSVLAGSVAGLTTAMKVSGPLAGTLSILGSIGSRLVPVVAFVTAAVSLFSLLGGKSSFKDAQAKLLAARESVAKAQAQLKKDLSEFEEFSVDAQGVGAEGTTVKGIQDLKTRISNFDDALQRGFSKAGAGVIAANEKALVDELVYISRNASDQGSQEFKDALGRLSQLLGRDVLQILDKDTLAALANEAAGIQDQSKALGEDLRSNITRISEFTGELTVGQRAIKSVVDKLKLEGTDGVSLIQGELDKLPKAMASLAERIAADIAKMESTVRRKGLEKAQRGQTKALVDAALIAPTRVDALRQLEAVLPSFSGKGTEGEAQRQKLMDRLLAEYQTQYAKFQAEFSPKGLGFGDAVQFDQNGKVVPIGNISTDKYLAIQAAQPVSNLVALLRSLGSSQNLDKATRTSNNEAFVATQNKTFLAFEKVFQSDAFQAQFEGMDKDIRDALLKAFGGKDAGINFDVLRSEDRGVVSETALARLIAKTLSAYQTTTQNKRHAGNKAILDREFVFPPELTEEIARQRKLAGEFKTQDPARLAISNESDKRLDNPINRLRDIYEIYYDLLKRDLTAKTSAAKDEGDVDAEKKWRKKLNKAIADEGKTRQELASLSRTGIHALSKKELTVKQAQYANQLTALSQEEEAAKREKITGEQLLDFENRRRVIILNQIAAEEAKLALDKLLTKEAQEALDLRRAEAEKSKYSGSGVQALISADNASLGQYRRPTLAESITGQPSYSTMTADADFAAAVALAQLRQARKKLDEARQESEPDQAKITAYRKEVTRLSQAYQAAAHQADNLGRGMGDVELMAWRINSAFDADQINAKLQRTKYSIENVGETIQDQLVQGFEAVLDAAVESSGSGVSAWVAAREAIKNLVKDIMKTIVKAYAQRAFQLVLAAIVGGGDSSYSYSGSGASGSHTGGVATGGTIRSGRVQNSFATGGIISGPGTGTSDSVPASVVGSDGRRTGGVLVSNGEAILNAGAVKALGEDWVHATNKMHFKRYASGGIIGSTSSANANVGKQQIELKSKVDLNGSASGLSPDQVYELSVLMDRKITTTLEDEKRPGGILNRG